MFMINLESKHPIGSYCEIHGIEPVRDLVAGSDFRRPEFRRETFLRFYEFHLKYRSHPGAVYFMFDYLKEEYNLSLEDMLWISYINGVSQNIVTTWDLFQKFPKFTSDADEIQEYIFENWAKLVWDMDRRYVKSKFSEALKSYQKLVLTDYSTQEEFWANLCSSDDEYENFRTCWDMVINNFSLFGRLSTFSYLEYQRIIGINLDCDRLFLDDMKGSKSHRNGLSVVLGRDDLDWHDKLNPDFEGYRPEHIEWLEAEGEKLLSEAKERFKSNPDINQRDVSYFTLESTLCCYKSWHRPNRRYPNVYMDMFHDRIRKAEQVTRNESDYKVFWEARKKYLPTELRLEDNPEDCGLSSEKQNHYRLTGQPVMMNICWDCFENDFNNAKPTVLEEFML